MALKTYFVGFYATSGDKVICKAKSNSTIDTTWGINGYWGMSVGGYQTTIVRDIVNLADGRTLAAHNAFPPDGVPGNPMAVCTMLLPDGTIDTSWGTNGQYLIPGALGFNQCRAILRDESGNFYLFGGVSDTGLTYLKLDPSGVKLWDGPIGYGKLRCFYDAIFADAAQTRIIAVGAYSTLRDLGPPDSGYVYGNIMAIKTSDGTLDKTWDQANVWPGWALFSGTDSLYHVKRLSDGGFVVMRNAANTLSKILADGSAKDTAWGTAGDQSVGSITLNPEVRRITQDGDEIYTNAYTTQDTLTRLGADGSILAQHVMSGGGQDNYRVIEKFNTKLLLSSGKNAPALHHIEQWTKAFVYEEGFDLTNSSYVFTIRGEAPAGGRQLILGRKRGSKLAHARHTTLRNVFG